MAKFKPRTTNKNILFGVLFVLFCSCNRVSEVSVVEETVSKDSIGVVLDDVVNVEVPVENVQEDTIVITIPKEVVIETPVVIKRNITDVYLSQIGVREATGKNDGPEVEMYLKSVKLGKGYAWCSAFVKWSLDEAEIPNKINAWSPTAENQNNFVFKNKKFIQEPQPGDIGTLYYPKLKRIGHTYFFHKRINNSNYESVEGNTSIQGSRDGDGVYRRIRSFNATHSISRWD